MIRRKRPSPRKHQKGVMNSTERAYADILNGLMRDGKIIRWMFESIQLRLADRTTYTPDFLVVLEDEMQFHEVKGGIWQDDSRVKIKVAAEMYPEFAFVGAMYRRKQWTYEQF